MFKRLFVIVALAFVIFASVANAADRQMVRHQPVSAKAVSVATGNALEFPADLLPEVTVFNSGYRVFLSASVPLPPADSDIAFAEKVEVWGSLNNSQFAWLKVIPVKQELSADRWWFDTTTPERLSVNNEIGDASTAGDHVFRVKVYYTAYGVDAAIVYEFDVHFNWIIFWAMPCRFEGVSNLVGLDLFIKTLFPVSLGTQVNYQLGDVASGYGTLDVGESATTEWPLYSNVVLGASEFYDSVLSGTSHPLSIEVMGQGWRVEQDFWGPAELLPVCGQGGGGKG